MVTLIGLYLLSRSGGPGKVPGTLPISDFPQWNGSDRVVFRGGAWVNGINVSWPFVVLTVDSLQAELRAPLMSPIRILRSEVVALQWSRGIFGEGIKFQTESGRLDRITFWPVSEAVVKLGLTRLGW